MNDITLSTSSTLPYIIKSGHVSQSPFSEAFIKTIEERLKINVVACYIQIEEYLTFRKGKPTGDFVDDVVVFLHVRESSLNVIQARDGASEEIEAIFWSTFRSLGLQCSYQRVYTPEELKYYGFLNKPREQWDMDKVQKPTSPPQKRFFVKIESFDQLALYHLLSDRAQIVRNYMCKTYGVNVKVYVGFSKASPYTARHVIAFGTQTEYDQFLSRVCSETVRSGIREVLKRYDLWDVLSTCGYHPQYRVWTKLSGEEKMCLLRN